MKFGPVTKPDKRNISTSKKISDDVLLVSCDIVWPIWSNAEAGLRTLGPDA